jgi:hypothetical protein
VGIRSASPTRLNSSTRIATLALLTLADTAFLWMFLATDPLTQLAGELGGRRELADDALGFAAAWRHGMAGNSWVYLPGFSATAAAVWLHARHCLSRGASPLRLPNTLSRSPLRRLAPFPPSLKLRRTRRSAFGAKAGAWLARFARSHRGNRPQVHEMASRLVFVNLDRILAGAFALVLARAAAPPSAAAVVHAFENATNVHLAEPIPSPSAAAMFSGAYTLCAWSVFVLACRTALVRRTLRPFVAAAILAAGLVVIRPWTVDEFTNHWAAGILAGTAAAWGSLALVFVLAGLLAAVERRSPQPQPGERTLQMIGTTHDENADQIRGDGDRIEAG